ncbi:MAG: hypothetical protein PHE51_00115 [Eubacteriales bacterium]|nr:hypothetical protein [Eubacteriales bacterium]
MISKRTAVILIIAIALILGVETKFFLGKYDNMQANIDKTVVQVMLTVDDKLVSLKDCEVSYKFDGTKPLLSKLSDINDTGYEGRPNNSVAYKMCGKDNTFTMTIPVGKIPGYDRALHVEFGFMDNPSDFANYSLMLDIKTSDELTAKVTQKVYYPDENRETQQRSTTAEYLLSDTDKIECFIK